MATQLASDFTFYDRTPEEARNGSILTADNIIHIQNLLGLAAVTLLNIESDPTNPGLAELQRAKLQGEIGAYRTLINTSREAEAEVFEEAKTRAQIEEQKQKYADKYEMFKNNLISVTPPVEKPTPVTPSNPGDQS